MNGLLIGCIVVGSMIVGLFFLRFWVTTKDNFFLLFALSFWIDAMHRLAMYAWTGYDEASPMQYLPRLVAYGLIVVAIVNKNRSRKRGP